MLNGFALFSGPGVGIVVLTLKWARLTASAVLIGQCLGATLAFGVWVTLNVLGDHIFAKGIGKTCLT